jgi:hypothetical protein
MQLNHMGLFTLKRSAAVGDKVNQHKYLFQLNFWRLLLVEAWHRCCFKCQALPKPFNLSLLALLSSELILRIKSYRCSKRFTLIK